MDKSFQEILQEQMQSMDITVEKIQQQTGILERYITAFIEGKKEKLPAKPYVRGYIFKIATTLNLNGEELWQSFIDDKIIRKSGAKDLLPYNRYALRIVNKKWLVLSAILILVVVYGAINFNRLLGSPDLKIVSPAAETLVTTASTITLIGNVTSDGKLTIDGNEVIVEQNGSFREEYFLQPGLNRIEFSVKGLLSQETKVIRQIIYQP
jgi:cytoskeletal protein RodZ